MTQQHNAIQLGDIQAHIIRSARPAAAKYFFLSISDPVFLAQSIQQSAFTGLLLSEQKVLRMAEHNTSDIKHRCFINIGFSYSGLIRLGLPNEVLKQFPPAFKEGMAKRAHFIGDQGSDSPMNWESFYGSQHIHLLIGVNYMPWLEPYFTVPKQWSQQQQDAHFQQIDACWKELCNGQDSILGTHCLIQEQAHVIRSDTQVKEHFGFADGVSQPCINDGMPRKGVGGKKKTNDSNWEPLAAGEFLLGYYDELGMKNVAQCSKSTVNPLLPESADSSAAAYQQLTMNGSFLVYRKLEQDVIGFRAFCESNGGIADKLVGRKADGTPLVNGETVPRANDFDFADDPDGVACPFASHVRRVNPRLTLTAGLNEGTVLVDQHRIIRRGMAYGPYIEPGSKDTDPEARRGLHFFCYNARVDSQFEFIQKNWINNCDFMHMSSPIVDPIVGNRQNGDLGQFSFDRSTKPLFGLQQYVHVKGGEYFFTPGLASLSLIATLTQPTDPFLAPKQHIQPFDSLKSDPIDVRQYVDANKLLTGSRFVKLWIKTEECKIPYYYFAHPDDLQQILGRPNLFTNDLYSKRIQKLTNADMLLSLRESNDRDVLKKRSWALLEPQNLKQTLKAVLQPELNSIRAVLTNDKSIDLVEGLSRRLPLAIIKGFYGVEPVAVRCGELASKTQLAHYFDRTSYDVLPIQWQQNYAQYGFHTTADETLLFWARMLFLEVFLNQYGVKFISALAFNAAQEFMPHIDQQIAAKQKNPCNQDTLMSKFITMYQRDYGYSGNKLTAAVRQSLLELIVGSTDTTAKGIAMVVKTLLGFGQDLVTGLFTILHGNVQGVTVLQRWLSGDYAPEQEAQLDAVLDGVITTCLRVEPVAPLLPRYCTHGATYTTSTGELLNIEPGAIVCLVPQVTLGAHLKQKVSPQLERFIFMDGTPHACMGHQIAMLEMREALKLLLEFKFVRPAAGVAGVMKEKYKMPASMLLRCD